MKIKSKIILLFFLFNHFVSLAQFIITTQSISHFKIPESLKPIKNKNFIQHYSKNEYDVFESLDSITYLTFSKQNAIYFNKFKNIFPVLPTEDKIVFDNSNNKLCKVNGFPKIGYYKKENDTLKTIFISWSDTKFGNNHDAVFISYSKDEGNAWTEPIHINYFPNHKKQIFLHQKINPKNGTIYVLYLNSQNYIDLSKSDLYLAISTNEGLKFDHVKINSTPILNSKFILNTNFSSLNLKNDSVFIYWMQKLNSKDTLVYSSILTQKNCNSYFTSFQSQLEILDVEKIVSFASSIKINFNLKEKIILSASLSKPLETSLNIPILKNKLFLKGKNLFTINMDSLKVKNGNYTLTFYYNGITKYSWIINSEAIEKQN